MPRARKMFARTGIALLLSIIILIVFGLSEAIERPIERMASIQLRNWPKGAPPVRIALLSDIHLGNLAMSPGRLQSIVDQVNDASPDLVLIAGDFIVGHEAAGAADRAKGLSKPLRSLRAPLGVVAILGNHDHWTAPDAVRAALEQAGIAVLENAASRRGPLLIIGIGDAFSGHDDVGKALAAARGVGGVPIVLTHSPDLTHKLPRDLPLLLAGHTHCGQIVLPWLGPVSARSPYQHGKRLYDPRYRCGIVRNRQQSVIVTAGLGSGTVPLRIGAPPDWWLVTLHGGPLKPAAE